MATIYLIHGFLGAGKTTFARKLEQELGAVRFTHDEWMHRLYGADSSAEEFLQRYERVASLIWDYAAVLASRGLDVILDFGFWSRRSRQEARRRAEALGVFCILYSVECPLAVMKERTLARSQSLPADSLYIDEYAFDVFWQERFESLGEDEERTVICTG